MLCLSICLRGKKILYSWNRPCKKRKRSIQHVLHFPHKELRVNEWIHEHISIPDELKFCRFTEKCITPRVSENNRRRLNFEISMVGTKMAEPLKAGGDSELLCLLYLKTPEWGAPLRILKYSLHTLSLWHAATQTWQKHPQDGLWIITGAKWGWKEE